MKQLNRNTIKIRNPDHWPGFLFPKQAKQMNVQL
nr:MAG TPA: hypothetical protein [Caudoviricetes sp.]